MCCLPLQAQDWIIDTDQQWKQNLQSSEGATVTDGMVSPTAKQATIVTKLFSSDKKRSAASLTIAQSPIWQNWNPTKNLGPANLGDAPVMLTVGPKNYWMFGRYGEKKKRKKGKLKDKAKQAAEEPTPEITFVAQDATLEGFDVPLKTTKFANQFDAPGGLKPGKGGYLSLIHI